MPTPTGGLRPALILLAIVAMLVAPAVASAANRSTLHVGQADSRICGVKWMISGPHSHRPNVFTVRGTYTRPLKPGCNYAGKSWGAAVVAYKFRLGYPTKLVKPIAGPYFFALLHGTKHRPLLWVALAQRRAKAILTGPTKLAQQLVAFESRQLGTHESCCNRGSVKGPGGYSVDDFEGHFGLHGLQWCAIFQAFSWDHIGAPRFNPDGNRFYVPSIGQWAKLHGYLTARARVGELVAFLSGPDVLDGRHIGMIAAINSHGYYTLEGNSGDAVRRHYYDFGSALRVFIAVPGVA